MLDKLDDKGGEREEEQEVDLSALRQRVEDAPVMGLVNLMLAEVLEDRASDIHPGRYRDRGVVR